MSLSIRRIDADYALPDFLFTNARRLHLDVDLQVLIDCVERGLAENFAKGLAFFIEKTTSAVTAEGGREDPAPALDSDQNAKETPHSHQNSAAAANLQSTLSHLLRAIQSHRGTLPESASAVAQRVQSVWDQLTPLSRTPAPSTTSTGPSRRGCNPLTAKPAAVAYNPDQTDDQDDGLSPELQRYKLAQLVCRHYCLPAEVWLSGLSDSATTAPAPVQPAVSRPPVAGRAPLPWNAGDAGDTGGDTVNAPMANQQPPRRALMPVLRSAAPRAARPRVHPDKTQAKLQPYIKAYLVDKSRAAMTETVIAALLQHPELLLE